MYFIVFCLSLCFIFCSYILSFLINKNSIWCSNEKKTDIFYVRFYRGIIFSSSDLLEKKNSFTNCQENLVF